MISGARKGVLNVDTIPFKDRLEYLKKIDHRSQVLFALRCAKSVKQGPEGLACIDLVERWLDGSASSEECRVAADAAAYAAAAAAYAAADAYAAYAAADAAAYAADAAACAAYADAYAAYAADAADAAAYAADAYAADAAAYAVDAAALKEQLMKYLWELVHVDEVLEKALLGS